jgi:Protein of unknown function (DUF3795)
VQTKRFYLKGLGLGLNFNNESNTKFSHNKVKPEMKKGYIEIGICGLSCRLCPAYHRETKSKCEGCKSEYRMGAVCTFHTCAVKKKGIDFCGFCDGNKACAKWRKFREAAKQHDSFVCYQRLEDNIAFIQRYGMKEFEKQQETREKLLRAFLIEFNEGRSKSFYCIAATVLEIGELESVLENAREKSKGLDIKAKSMVMHSLLNEIADNRSYLLNLRK